MQKNSFIIDNIVFRQEKDYDDIITNMEGVLSIQDGYLDC